MCDNKWRFLENGYGQENGLDTSDMETFKQDPIASLAREICQNSIDAASDGTKPVIVEFSTFDVPAMRVPGIERLREEINACYEYKKDSIKEGKSLLRLKENIEKKRIRCLRISDFNTKGARGVGSSSLEENDFYNLTKGSGQSDKIGTTGGSKGIGKYASFVVSLTNTVFYSTVSHNLETKEVETGYIGISKLRSAPIPGQEDLKTTGVGYYGYSEKNKPIFEVFSLDPSFDRQMQLGTDIYIIGFDDTSDWINEIAVKVMESFMVAILRARLEVHIGDLILTKDTLKSFVTSEVFDKLGNIAEYRRICREVKAQLDLFENDDSIFHKELTILEEKDVDIYVKSYSQENESEAIKNIVMVRAPYMKIKLHKNNLGLPYSALCIIHEGQLHQLLRGIENPQHTAWEPNRLEKKEKTKANKILKLLNQTLRESLKEALHTSEGEKTDMEGAGAYLPSVEESDGLSQEDDIEHREFSVSVKPVKRTHTKASKASEPKDKRKGTEAIPAGDEPGEGKTNGTGGITQGGAGKPGGEGSIGNGRVSSISELAGNKYRTIVRNPKGGEYVCKFKSQHSATDCKFEIKLCGYDKDVFDIDILQASINGITADVKNGKIVGFDLEKNHQYEIVFRVNRTKIFASEVIIYGYR